MVYYCVYNNCKSNSRRIKSRKVKYYPFPKPKRNLVKCLRWIELCGNKKLTIDKINRNTFVCSKHFVRGFSDPSPFCIEPIEVAEFVEVVENEEVGISGHSDNSQSMVHSESSLVCPPNDTGDDSPLVAANEDEVVQDSDHMHDYHLHDHDYIGDNGNLEDNRWDHLPSESVKQSESEVSIDDGEQSAGDIFLNKNKFAYENLKKAPKEFKYFSGLELWQFEALFNFLDETVMGSLKYSYKNEYMRKHNIECNSVISKISHKDKLLLTLVRLRRGFTLVEMSYFCNLSKSYVSVIFFTWVQFMYHQIISIRGDQISESRKIQRVPLCFKNFDSENVNFVLDATEVCMEMPSNFRHQGNTFSSYKHSNTIKFLVMICPSGAIVYCSDGFEGAVSDVELFEKSDIRIFLEKNDVILADRGFLIRHLCDEMGVKVYIPPFLMERNKLTAEEERITKKIAKARIHVERAIGRIKFYRILSKRCPILLLPLISKIFTIICFLVNFEKPLV